MNANGTYTGGSNARAISANTGSGIADLLLGVASVSYNINPRTREQPSVLCRLMFRMPGEPRGTSR